MAPWKIPLSYMTEGRSRGARKNNIEKAAKIMPWGEGAISTNGVGTTGQPYAKDKVVSLPNTIYKT